MANIKRCPRQRNYDEFQCKSRTKVDAKEQSDKGKNRGTQRMFCNNREFAKRDEQTKISDIKKSQIESKNQRELQVQRIKGKTKHICIFHMFCDRGEIAASKSHQKG